MQSQQLQSPAVQTSAHADGAHDYPVTIPAALIGTLKLGQHYPQYGGTYCGMVAGDSELADYPIFAPTDPALLGRNLAYGGYGTRVTGADRRRCGSTNTTILKLADTEHPAAEYAAKVVYLDFDDYYLPSQAEAAVVVANVPELLQGEWIWTSTQGDAHYAWCQDPGGHQDWLDAHDEGAVLPVRRLLVIQ